MTRLTATLQRSWADSHPAYRRECLLLTLRDDQGREGVGEAAPLTGDPRETLDADEAALRNAMQRLGKLRAPGKTLRTLRPFLDRFDDLLQDLPAARFALEGALLDLTARATGRTVARLLSGFDSDRVIEVNGLQALDQDLTDTRRLGLRTVKIKVGRRDFQSELEGLRRLARALGPEVTLRLDVNGAWSLQDAPGYLQALVDAGLAIAYVEQPVPPADLPLLPRGPVPVFADESMQDDDAVERIMEGRTGCAGVVLKPTRLGLLGAWEQGMAALATGLDVTVTHAFEGPVAIRLCCEVALALPRTLACGLLPDPSRLEALAPLLPHLRLMQPPFVAWFSEAVP